MLPDFQNFLDKRWCKEWTTLGGISSHLLATIHPSLILNCASPLMSVHFFGFSWRFAFFCCCCRCFSSGFWLVHWATWRHFAGLHKCRCYKNAFKSAHVVVSTFCRVLFKDNVFYLFHVSLCWRESIPSFCGLLCLSKAARKDRLAP